MNESIQKKIGRVRPPRVHITYDLETEGAIISKELPCIIGIIADLTGKRGDNMKQYSDRSFIFVDQDNFNDIMKSVQARVDLAIEILGEQQEISIMFKSMEDFKPLNIIAQIDPLKKVFETRTRMSDLKTRISNSAKLLNAIHLLASGEEAKLDEIKFQNDDVKKYVAELFDEFKSLLTDDLKEENQIVTTQNIIKSLDDKINQSLDNILHNSQFQQMEATWTGLFYLVKNMEIGESLKLRVLNANFKEIYDDVNNALEFDQSFLFKKLYEEEYGTYGGNPFSVLGINFYMERNQQHFNFLHKIVESIACAHIPTVMGLDSSLFDLDSYTDLNTPRDVAKIFESPELAKFKSFRMLEDSRYVSFVLPRFMGRIPFGPNTEPIEGLNYKEDTSSHDKFLWVNSMFAYIQRIADSFARYNWFSSVVGPENGGMVSNLPVYLYKTKDGDTLVKCPTEVAITDRRERELSQQGMISLCYSKDTDYSVFFGCQSANKPLKFDSDVANANAELSARFHYMLNVSRFAHYIKCIMRDKIGSFATISSVSNYLNNWITSYVLLNETDNQDLKARFPLKEAKVVVDEDPAKPGKFQAIIFLRPHFQMEELTVSLRLVSRIPEIS